MMSDSLKKQYICLTNKEKLGKMPLGYPLHLLFLKDH